MDAGMIALQTIVVLLGFCLSLICAEPPDESASGAVFESRLARRRSIRSASKAGPLGRVAILLSVARFGHCMVHAEILTGPRIPISAFACDLLMWAHALAWGFA